MRMNAHCYKAMGGLKIWYNDECFEFDWQTATKFNECTNYGAGQNQNKNNYELFNAYRWESAHTVWWHSLSENITVNLNLVRLRFGSALSVTQPNNRTIKNEMCANGFLWLLQLFEMVLCNNCQKSGWNYDYLLSISCSSLKRDNDTMHLHTTFQELVNRFHIRFICLIFPSNLIKTIAFNKTTLVRNQGILTTSGEKNFVIILVKNYDTENEKETDRAKERTKAAYCFWSTHRWNSNATVPNWRLIAHKLNMMIFAAMMSSSSLSAFDEWWRLFILHLSCDFALRFFLRWCIFLNVASTTATIYAFIPSNRMHIS